MRYNNARFPALLSTICGLAESASAQIDLRTAAEFRVIASSAVSNTENTVMTGNLGLFPNTESSITGFPPGLSGTVDAANGVADQALQDARTAYNTAATQATTAQISVDLGGQILVAGTYTSGSAVQITGPLTLDARNDPNALFVFQIGTTLTTASASSVVLVNGAQACNVFFQVGSSATLGSTTAFNGNILALTSISLSDGATVNGGLYALTGAVTLINNQIVAQQACVVDTPASTGPGTIVASSADVISTTSPVDDMTTTIAVPSDVTTISGSGFTSIGTGTFITRTTTGPPMPTTPTDGDITTIPGDEIVTTFTDRDGFTATLPGDDFTSTLLGSSIITTLPGSNVMTTVPGSVIITTITRPTASPSTGSNSPTTSRERSTRPNRPTSERRLSTVRTSYRHATKSISAKALFVTNGYDIYTPSSVRPSASGYRAKSHESLGTGSAQSRLAVGSKTRDGVTNINGTPCTTLSYFEPTCSCTQTTVIPIAFTPAPQVVTMELITVSGVPCTATQYYEESCDCVRTSNVPIQVVNSAASIATIINNVPCIVSKYYETASNCIQTATVPVRIASAGELPFTAVDAEYVTTANALFLCISAYMQPYMPTLTTTSTETSTETATQTTTQTFHSTETCSPTPRYRM